MNNIFDIAQSMPSFKKIEVSSVLFSEYKCLETAEVFRAWSHLNYFVYVINGKKQWRTIDNNYMVYANEALFIKKGANIIHKFFKEQFCALLIFIPDSFIRDFMATHAPTIKNRSISISDSVIPLNLDKSLGTYFESLYAYFFREEHPSADLVELKFKELVLNIISSRSNEQVGNYFYEITKSTKPSIPSIMEANYIHNLSLNEFARLTQRSLTSFKRDFQECFGISPGRWLITKRLQHAQGLLENSDKKVFEVAFECGFENPSHFNRVFKDKIGKSPLQFKKLQTEA